MEGQDMSCPHLLEGIHPFCRATRETLVAGLHDLPLGRSGFWAECPAVTYAVAVVEVDPDAPDAGIDRALDREAPGIRAPTSDRHRGRMPHEITLEVWRLMRARAGS
jgi:hypothetical protein